MCADSLLLFKEKKCPIFKWIVSVPFPSEISTNFGAEHFSYLYRVALKIFVVLRAKQRDAFLRLLSSHISDSKTAHLRACFYVII